MTMTETRRQSISDAIADGSLGVFTVVAIVFLVWGALWLRDNTHMHPPRFINVFFHDTAQLSDGANVFLDGVRVGAIDEIHWRGEHRVLVRLRITNHKIKMPVGSRFDILNNGIVGAKYVEIIVPDRKPGDPEAQELVSESTVEGEDPVRPELALNNLVVGLSRIDTEQLGRNFDADRARICRAADQLAMLANKTMPVIDQALPLEGDLHQLSKESTKIAKRANHFLDNPHFSNDLRETVQTAKETVETVKSTVDSLETTLKDKNLRGDLVGSLQALHESTQELERTVNVVQKITSDTTLRSDAKDILKEANQSLNKVKDILNNPTYGNDIKNTLSSTRDAVDHIDLAAKQLNQILDKRSPLIHLLIGRPGLIREVKAAKNVRQTTQIKKLQTAQPQGSQTTQPVQKEDGQSGSPTSKIKVQTETETTRQTMTSAP